MMLLAVGLAGLFGFSEAKECECTGNNEGIPAPSPHAGTDFGHFCKAWDEKYGECTKFSFPKWCLDKWCYVEEGCTVNGEVVAIESTYKDSGLFYSYEVCGSVNNFNLGGGFTYRWEDCPDRDYPLDVYFAIDASGSIDEDEWKNMQSFMQKLLSKGFQHPQDRVGITTWSKDIQLRFDFTSSIEKIIEDIGKDMVQNKGDTYTDLAILKTLEYFEAEDLNDDAKKYLILITDGEPDDGHGPCDTDKNQGKVDEIRMKLDELELEVGVLAINGINKKDFQGTLKCLVDENALNEEIVEMDNFYSFYQYRDPTQGDICVDAGLFKPTAAPTEVVNPPTPSPTECVMTDDSEEDEVDDSMCAKMKKNRCRNAPECDYLEDKKVCMGKGSKNICAGIKYESTCTDHKNCEWDGRMCSKAKPVPRGKDWLDTQGPLFWATCAKNFCEKHVWEGGITRCHYEAKTDGCGCMGLELGECALDNDCMVKNCQCEDKPKCETLTFDECKADDRCAVCDGAAGGCTRKCSMSPDSTLDENQTLVLDHYDCKCKIYNAYPTGELD